MHTPGIPQDDVRLGGAGGSSPALCTHGEKVPRIRMAPKKTPRSRISDEIIGKLFELVRKNPCLCDCTLPDHRDAVKISNTWQSIAKKLDISGMTGM